MNENQIAAIPPKPLPLLSLSLRTPMGLLLLLLSVLLSLSLSSTSGGLLSKLGFSQLSPAAAAVATWHGPTTVFAPTDSSLLTCPSCSVPKLLLEHTVPGIYNATYLRTLAFGTKIETLAPARCLTITSQYKQEINNSKVFVGGVEITCPDLYMSQNVVIHGIQGFLSLLSPLSCQVERATSLSFPPQSLPLTSSLYITRVMLKDAILRLRISGFSLLALSLKLRYDDLLDLQAMTLFALDDETIFSSNDRNRYVSNLRLHIVPNRRLMAADLEGLAAGVAVPTMDWGESVVVTTPGGGGGGLVPLRINYVKVTKPDLLFNLKVAVHGVEVGFRRVNLTAAIAFAKGIGRCDWDGVCEAPGVAPVAGIEDRHEIW